MFIDKGDSAKRLKDFDICVEFSFKFHIACQGPYDLTLNFDR